MDIESAHQVAGGYSSHYMIVEDHAVNTQLFLPLLWVCVLVLMATQTPSSGRLPLDQRNRKNGLRGHNHAAKLIKNHFHRVFADFINRLANGRQRGGG